MLVQPTQGEGASSESQSEAPPTPSTAPTSEVPYEPHTDSSPAHTSEIRPSNTSLKANHKAQEARKTGHQTSESISEECLMQQRFQGKKLLKET
ncbi:hypothetical protein Tco_0511524 [Tanacetum coccineum]